VTGACRLADDTCIDGMPAILCALEDGAFQGADTTCADIECDAAAGCPADLNGNGFVGVQDLIVLIMHWGPCGDAPCTADLDGDGTVGIGDLIQLVLAWGACP
jgi:hypothetical protein